MYINLLCAINGGSYDYVGTWNIYDFLILFLCVHEFYMFLGLNPEISLIWAKSTGCVRVANSTSRAKNCHNFLLFFLALIKKM